MTIFKLVLGVVLLALVGGFGYFALSDVAVEQTAVTKTIPNERFFDEN